jgi:hypothetical protein
MPAATALDEAVKRRPADAPPPREMQGALVHNGRLRGMDESKNVLEDSSRAWDGLEEDRERRRTARDYLFGDQWGETIETPDGDVITERRAIEERGREPWEMNRVRPIVRNLKGQLRQNESDRQVFAVNREDNEAARVMTQVLREARKINQMTSIEAQQFVEHLLSGKAAFRVGYKYMQRFGRPEVSIQPVNTLRLFYNGDLTDRRGRDLTLVGQLHDMQPEDVVASFAPRDPEVAEAIEEHYGTGRRTTRTDATMPGFARHDGLNFRTATETDLVRVIEAWRRETRVVRAVHDHDTGRVHDAGDPDEEGLTRQDVMQENAARRRAGEGELELFQRREQVWVGYFLTPTGEILWAGETPYEHGEHPFILGFGDMLDGEVRGLVDDLIDQQRLYNRMIQIMDLGLSTSARGVLMIPREMIPDDMSPQDFAEEYQKVNGVVVYEATQDNGQPLPSNHVPEQVFSNSIPAGAFQWLQQMDREMKSASGVQGPMMGEEAGADTPAALYNRQIVQSQTTNLDQFETYFETLRDLDLKAIKVAAQFHDDGRVVRGEADEGVVRFNAQQIRDLEFDVSIAQVEDTAVFRQLFEQDLKELLGGGLLTFRQYLKTSSHPKADALLELIERTNPLVQGQGGEQGQRQQASAPQSVSEAVQQMGGEQRGQPSPQQQRQVRAQLVQAAENGDQQAEALLAQAA